MDRTRYIRERVKRPFQYVRSHSPILSAPVPSLPTPPAERRSGLRKALFISGTSIIGLCTVALVMFFLLTKTAPYERKLHSLQEQVPFSLYKPLIPKGYSLEPEDIKIVDGIVFMNLRDTSKGIAIEISQQPMPATKIDELFNDREAPITTQTKNGKLVQVESVKIRSGILITSDSWINITLPVGHTETLIEDIASNLARLGS